ncbi:MAG: TRAP transporter large permease [Chloroflexi bacterium]|nr:TRAP transporter large permease [Chloroflexota bacterium]
MNVWTIIGLILILILFLSGAPLAIAFGLGALLIALLAAGLPIDAIASMAFNSINSFPLLAMPFFILAGNLLLRSGGMADVRDFLQSWIGQWRGGLAAGALVIGAFLGAVSGSTTACLAIMGTVVLPIMVEAGYSRPFSSAIALNGAELGWIIPPSLAFIIFGALNQVSIADLFLSGIGPGLLMAAFMIVPAVIISRRRGYPAAPRVSWKGRGRSFLRAFPMLLMPVIVLGGIYAGIFSPTESAAVGCLYTLILGIFVYRQLNWAGIKEALLETAKLGGMIYILIVAADLFSKMISFMELPQMIGDWVLSFHLGPLAFLLAVEALLLAMGFLFSSIPMIIIVLPIFLPTVKELGIDPVFYGCLAVICTAIGEITPPMGPQLWFAAPICKEKMGKIMKESWVFLGAMVLALLVVTFVPDIPMFLVNLFR